MNIEEFLKNSLDIEKEAWAVAEALQNLAVRGETSADLYEEYAHDLTQIEKRTEKIAQMVAAVPNHDQKQVLAGRYLYKRSWSEIEARMHASKSSVHRMHRRGIAWLEENYREK